MVVPKRPHIKRQILTELHDSKNAGHAWEQKILDLVKRYFWWPHMDADCKHFVKGCSRCQRNKAPTRQYTGLLQQHDLPTQRQQVSMNVIQSLPVTAQGNDMVMTAFETLTKIVHFVPCMAAMNSAGTAKLYVKEVFKLQVGKEPSSAIGTPGSRMTFLGLCASSLAHASICVLGIPS